MMSVLRCGSGPIKFENPLRWRHNDHDSVSNHQPLGCLLNRLFRRRSKKTSKLRVTGLCVGNSPGEFPAQRASYEENVSIWWRHHAAWIHCKEWAFRENPHVRLFKNILGCVLIFTLPFSQDYHMGQGRWEWLWISLKHDIVPWYY